MVQRYIEGFMWEVPPEEIYGKAKLQPKTRQLLYNLLNQVSRETFPGIDDLGITTDEQWEKFECAYRKMLDKYGCEKAAGMVEQAIVDATALGALIEEYAPP